jgi:C4-dicarboxylate transporter DctM subunit
MILTMFAVFFLAMLIGFPIAFCLGLSSAVYLIVADIPLNIIPQRMFSGIDSFVILCVPGFILAGNLMNVGGITERIIDFSNALVGRIRGGLSLANIAASVFFAGISGTAAADTASIGAILIPAMKKTGYEADFSCAVTAASSMCGPIIPPSLPMIVAGTVAGLSVSKLFIAGVVPGLLLGLALGVVSYYISVKRNHPKEPPMSLKQFFASIWNAVWALLLIVLIFVGIANGYFTPTEAAMVAVVYAIVIGVFVYRNLGWKDLTKIFLDTAITTSSLMMLVGLANLFAWILTTEQVPQMVAEWMLDLTRNKYLLLLMINILLLFVGTFMETIAAVMILMPILLNVAVQVGVDPIQFTVMCVLNLVIGLNTPPVGVCLFIASGIGKVSIMDITKALLPFLAASFVVLGLVTYVPQVTLFLPNLLLGR